jgi:hypothetical protein
MAMEEAIAYTRIAYFRSTADEERVEQRLDRAITAFAGVP